MSYSGYKSSPRGGRGFIRGGYRGSNRGEGGSWRSGGRGYQGSGRGGGRGSRFASSGGKWDRDSTSGVYESRPRYISGGERYTSHGREDGSYRYRGDESISSYSSREHSHRTASPERKRMRPDYSPASSMHRSHDYGEGIDYSTRSYGGYESKRISSYGGGDDRRNLFREERERIRSDDYQFRKPLSIGGPRHSAPRGSTYRGRPFTRGLRSGFRRPESYRGGVFLKKRVLMENYGVRRRIATGKTQEYLRRLKLYRLQRLRRLRERAEKEGSDEDDDEENEDEVEEEEEIEEEITEEVTDEDNEEVIEKEDEESMKKEVDNEDEEMEEGGEEKKDDPKKKIKKVKKMVKVVKKVKRKVPKVKGEEKEKTDDGEGQDIHVTVKQDSEGRDVDAPIRKNFLGQPFIKLECPHCHSTCATFKEYLLHLYKTKHQTVLSNVTLQVRKSLAKLRLEQRTEQRDIDEECKLKKMNMRTFYCMVCKLNYRSLKSEHLRSDKHKEMMNFLNPYCKICRVSCRSPMMYENHICSLNHLKRKYYYDKKNAENQEGNELDMDKYMILDQVGSGEEESDSESSEKATDKVKEEEEDKEGGDAVEDGEKEPKEIKPKKKKKLINLGSEYCKKMEIYFCELCKSFLPRIEDQEQALAVHCRGSGHLRWYVKKKDDLALRKRAERIHRMREDQKKALLKEEEKEGEPMDVDVSEDQSKSQLDSNKTNSSSKIGENEEPDVEAEMDDKVWSEVNKDLGELLREVDVEEPGNKSSDDEEDSRAAGRRYDRFKHSEKVKAGKVDESETKSVDEKIVIAEVVNGDDDKDDA